MGLHPYLWVQFCRFGAAAKEEKTPNTSFWGSSFETSSVLIRIHIVNHSPDNNQDNDLDANNRKVEIDETQAFDDLAVLLSTLEL